MMIDAAMLAREREELAQGLERLRAQQAEMARAVLMQEGALWYVERLLGMAESDAGTPPRPSPLGEGANVNVMEMEG